MVGDFDIEGNPFGTDSVHDFDMAMDDPFDDPFDSIDSFDDSF